MQYVKSSVETCTGHCGRREKGFKNVFDEIMAKNLLKLKEETDIQVQEIQRTPNKMNPNRLTPRHIIIKTAEVRENFKDSKRKAERHVQGTTRLFVYFDWFFLKGQQRVA